VLKKKKKGCSGDDDFVNRASVLAAAGSISASARWHRVM